MEGNVELQNTLQYHKFLLPIFKNIENDIKNHKDPKIRSWKSNIITVYNVRKKRGGSKLSNHSWGIALDINQDLLWKAEKNGIVEEGDYSNIKVDYEIPKEIIKILEKNGFIYGGGKYWRNKPDRMHFELSAEKIDELKNLYGNQIKE
jgi:hypothetical protein